LRRGDLDSCVASSLPPPPVPSIPFSSFYFLRYCVSKVTLDNKLRLALSCPFFLFILFSLTNIFNSIHLRCFGIPRSTSHHLVPPLCSFWEKRHTLVDASRTPRFSIDPIEKASSCPSSPPVLRHRFSYSAIIEPLLPFGYRPTRSESGRTTQDTNNSKHITDNRGPLFWQIRSRSRHFRSNPTFHGASKFHAAPAVRRVACPCSSKVSGVQTPTRALALLRSTCRVVRTFGRKVKSSQIPTAEEPWLSQVSPHTSHHKPVPPSFGLAATGPPPLLSVSQ
jgi:hypothetical protein